MRADLPARTHAGYFGKLPRAPDFVRCDLPSSFIALWSSWLNAMMAAAEDHLNDAFQEVYLTSPVWQFILNPGVSGEQAATGVFLPSCDKLGRCFHFSIVTFLPYRVDLTSMKISNADWFQKAVSTGVGALDDHFDLEVEILHLGVPREAPLAPQRGSAEVLLWTEGSTLIKPITLRLAGLPERSLAGALIDGGWHEHGWPRAGNIATLSQSASIGSTP